MDNIKIAFLGDLMPGGVLSGKNYDFISNDVLSFLNNFDIRIATLECAIGNNFAFDKIKMENRQNIIYSKNEDLDKLKTLKINLVSLANNHIVDLGLEGFENTIEQLKVRNIKYCGAGVNEKEASKPAIVELKNKTLAFFAYCYTNGDIKEPHIASTKNFGVNPLLIEKIEADVISAKKKYDFVFTIIHWGNEYSYYPTNTHRKFAFKIIKAGVDGIIGGHTHQIQPVIKIKKKPVFFSLGNFLFPDFYMKPPRPIWYPEKKENLTNIQITNEYPFPIKIPVLRVWPRKSRIGMIGIVILKQKKIKTAFKLTVLNNSNKIHFLQNNFKTSYFIKLISLLTASPFFFLIPVTRKLVRILKK